MDSGGGMGLRMGNWPYYDRHPLKGSLGLQLMSSDNAECEDRKPVISSSGFTHHDCRCIFEPLVLMNFARNGWGSNRDEMMGPMMPITQGYSTIHGVRSERDVQVIEQPVLLMPKEEMVQLVETGPGAGNEPPLKKQSWRSSYSVVHWDHSNRDVQMIQQPVLLRQKEEKVQLVETSPGAGKEPPSKKRPQRSIAQGQLCKVSKPRMPRKTVSTGDESKGCTGGRGRTSKKSTEVVINGIHLDISVIQTPVCSCTGAPWHCYRWGMGGWQSACCTNSISVYPLPVSTKRKGVRITGRKMSLGAFTKVLGKLAGEGYDMSNPIDLRSYWAKHGTNKFVTIR